MREVIARKRLAKAKRKERKQNVVGDKFTAEELRKYVPEKIFKSKEERAIIRASLAKHFLFSGLQFSQIENVIDCMKKEESLPGSTVITQGDGGDKFYVIEQGCFDIYVKDVLVVTYHAGQNFGELALMYNCPRAATIKTEKGGTLFALDRMGFHQFMKEATLEEEADISGFISSVKLLSDLSSADKKKLSDSFTRTKYKDGDKIITEGDMGDIFYIMEEGLVDVFKSEKKIMQLVRGDFFGERALLENKPRAATCVARGEVSCLALLRTEFETIIGRNLKKDMEAEHEGRKAIEKKVSDADPSNVRQLIKCTPSDFQFQTIIGKGAFGMVKLVKYKPTSRPMAMKQMQKARIVMTKQSKNVIQEKRIMQEMDHPFLLKLIAVCNDANCLYLITEFLQGGDIFAKLCDCDGIFSVETTKYYIACVTEAFDYIHNLMLIYRDLKPENLVLTEQGVLKVVDFGMAKRVPHITFTVCGTPEYMAPEIIHGKGHNKAVDYWALGILVYEMIIGHTPFADPSNNHLKIYKKIDRHCKYNSGGHHSSKGKKTTIEFPQWMKSEPDVVNITHNFLMPKPTMRLGCSKGGCDLIRQHPWFKKTTFNWEALRKGKLKPPIVPKVSDKFDAVYFDEWGPDTKDILPYEPTSAEYEKLWDAEF